MSTACSVLTADRFFSFFYVAAFAAALALLYVEGRRRAWPTSSWLVLVAVGITFGTIGSRLGAISLADWNTALGHGSLPTTTGKTFVGLILLGIAGIFLVQRFIGFRSTTESSTIASRWPTWAAVEAASFRTGLPANESLLSCKSTM